MDDKITYKMYDSFASIAPVRINLPDIKDNWPFQASQTESDPIHKTPNTTIIIHS